MRKKHLASLLAITTTLAIGSSFMFSINNDLTIFKVKADKEYNCALPDGFYEIEDVIAQAFVNGETEIDNNRPFRGTVTAIACEYIYVQRKNQLNGKIDGIRVKFANDYDPSHIEINNVIDFSGGYLFIEDGQPTLRIYGNNQYEIAYATNPYGFEPTVYNNLTDYYAYGFRSNNLAYDASKLVTINSLSLTSVEATWSYLTVLSGREIVKAVGHYDTQDINIYILTSNDEDSVDYYSLLSYACANDFSINITGYLNVSDGIGLGIHIAKPNCIEVNYTYDNSVFRDRFAYSSYMDSINYYVPVSSIYYPINSEIPYVEFSEFYNKVFAPLFYYGDVNNNCLSVSSYDSDKVTYLSNNGENNIVLSNTSNTVTMTSAYNLPIDNFWYFGPNGEHYLGDGIETNFCHVDWTNSSVFANKILTKTFDLDQYNINIIQDSSHKAYIPYSIADAILIGMNGYSFAFNGKDAYLSCYISNNYTQIMYRYFYTSPWHNAPTMGSQEFCDYSYNSLCFTLDNCYGLIDRNFNGDADTFIASTGLKNDLKSTDPTTYEYAFQKFTALYLFDGHAGYGYRSPKTDHMDIPDEYSYGYWQTQNPRYNQLYGTRDLLDAKRNAAGFGVGLRMYDNMAVITFDSFIKYQGNSTTYDLNQPYSVVHNAGTDLLFRKAFNEIVAAGNIDYIVIDDARNGGGMVDAIPFLLAYLTIDPSITSYNSMTGEIVDIHYDIDLNQNGIFNEATDTFANRGYQFFLLTSRYSFSCGNLFPTIVKDKGLATIIGQRSGGGECVVGYLSTAHGATLRNSALIHCGHWDTVNGEFIGNEDGILVDYELDYNSFYDNAALLAFIESIAA